MTNASRTALELRDALRRVAEWDSNDGAIVSAYLDLRPDIGNPQVRSGLIVLRDALRAAGHEGFVDTMSARIEAELLPDAIGAAVFTDGGDNWEALPTGEPIKSGSD